MPLHRVTTQYALGDAVRWAGEPQTRFTVVRILFELRDGGLGPVVTYGLHDPVQPRPRLVEGYEPDVQAWGPGGAP